MARDQKISPWSWLSDESTHGMPYDRLVRTQLMAPVVLSRTARSDASRSFLPAGDLKPESMAGNSTRAFVGLNLDCAPFLPLTRRS